MRIHELKCLPQYFGVILSGIKTFEIRLNDRNFKAGDVLILREYDPNNITGRAKEDNYTGDLVRKVVNYVLEDAPEFGLKKGYVIMSII